MAHLTLVLALLLTSFCSASAKGYYQLSARARLAYEQITALRMTEATATLSLMKRQEPDNLMVHHLENYYDFFDLYIREDESRYRARLPQRDKRLAAIADGEARSPYHLYVQAEIRLHWALLRLRFEDYWAAFNDINQAHRLLLRNQERFPDFKGNLKDLGILHAAVGTVPDEFRWALQLVSSLDGTVSQGKREIEQLLSSTRGTDFLYYKETQVLYAFLLLHLDNRPDAAWNAVQSAGLQPDTNPLHCFVIANIALRTNRNDQAISALERRPQGNQFMSFPFMSYMLGLAKLRRLDTNASVHLDAFVRYSRSRHYIKEAYQKLGWCELLAGNLPGYRHYMQLVQSKGHASAGGDKNALKEAELGQPPQLELLKARLLFDGGYHSRALQVLTTMDVQSLLAQDQLEYHYRRARVLHGLKRYDEALQVYEQVIADGSENPAVFACNSALQAGLIQEQRGRTESARQYYRLCLRISPDDHATALHQQAKAGISRLR